MKILTVSPLFPPDKSAGLVNHLINININLVKMGNDVSVIASKHIRDKISSPYENFKHVFRINSVYLPSWPYSAFRSISFPIDFGLKMKSIIRKGDFDIVHAHSQYYPISYLAIKLAHQHGIPAVLTLHGMYVLNPNATGGKSRVEDCFNKYMFRNILSKATAVIGFTEQVTNYAKRFGKENTKYYTIPNGTNTSIYKENLGRKKEFRQKYSIGQDSKVVLFCGRFEEVKGIIEFANAVKNIIKNKEVEVLIVGEGSLESLIRSILHGVDRIHILKWQPPDKIHELYIASDIFVIPSKSEALPLTIIEAMNSGLHIVYTPVGGIPDILKEYSQKTILKDGSSNEIQSVLTALISHFPITDKMHNSLIYAQKFDWHNIAIETSKVYAECTDSKSLFHP